MTAAVAAGHRSRLLEGRALAAAGVAAATVLAGHLLGWRGVDLPAQLYRVGVFRAHGFTLWDPQWFGGHWLLDYSVLFPALAATLGLWAVTAAAAAVATWAFDRLVTGHLGAASRAGTAVFAIGVATQSAIGQLTFLAGEAAGLAALLALARRRWGVAAALAAGAALLSPLDGAFVGVGAATLVVAGLGGRVAGPRPVGARVAAVRGPLAVGLAAAVPVLGIGVLFPGQGPMPFPIADWAWEVAVAGGLWLLAGRRRRPLRIGLALYVVLLTAAEVVASPLGGNAGRAEDVAALPLAVALLWGRRRLLLGAVAIPLALSQWSPAWAAMTTNRSAPWTHAAYYQPLVAWLHHAPGPAGRVEVVPTATHYEAVEVAPSVPLARGWERQLDIADDPIFYRPGALTPGSYRAWLAATGVRWVALPDAPLDPAGAAEARLVTAGVPGLQPVWRDAHWRVWTVAGSAGLAGPGERVVSSSGGRLLVVADRPGTAVVPVRWSRGWRVDAGAATVAEAPGGWLAVTAEAPGGVYLRIALP